MLLSICNLPKKKRWPFSAFVALIVIYDVSVKSEILFCKWGRLGNERSELTNPTNKIKSLLTRPSYIYFFIQLVCIELKNAVVLLMFVLISAAKIR
jgi:hypothetical protein